MDTLALQNHAQVFAEHISTFRETSKCKCSERIPFRSEVSYCLDEECSWPAVNFDDVQKTWYDNIWKTSGHLPCSVDALCLARNMVYVVEFKSGTNVDGVALFRKVYDTIMGLIEHDGQSYDSCRQRLVYVIVAPQTPSHRTVTRAAYYKEKPWEDKFLQKILDRWHLNNLTGVLVNDVIVLPPDLFSRFAKYNALAE